LPSNVVVFCDARTRIGIPGFHRRKLAVRDTRAGIGGEQ
jgi:hypothetical protein